MGIEKTSRIAPLRKGKSCLHGYHDGRELGLVQFIENLRYPFVLDPLRKAECKGGEAEGASQGWGHDREGDGRGSPKNGLVHI